MRPFLFAAFALLFAASAHAEERIDRFDVTIEVEKDGDILVTEKIAVTAEGAQINHGIFRDLPRYYEKDGGRLPYAYHVLGVTRDGAEEPYETSSEDNGFRVRIGDEDTYVEHGQHLYELRYRVDNQVRYFPEYDEVYWNATGNYWLFPITTVQATVVLPPGARITGVTGYTGPLGAAGSDYSYTQEGDRHVFVTTRPFAAGEGLTVAVGFAKGLIDPPSAADEGALLWQRYGALGVLLASLVGVFVYLLRNFQRVGRDPTKGPIFPQYEAPEGYSPAATHHIYHRGVAGHQALIATLMNLAVKGRIKIDTSDKKQTVLTRVSEGPAPGVPAEDLTLERSIFDGKNEKVIGKKVDTDFTVAYTTFTAALGREYGKAYFRWNLGYSFLALALSGLGIFVAVKLAPDWTIWHTLGVLALAALNGLFMYLMPAPTAKGQEVRTAIQGFRLYMETAEKLQLNAVEVGSAAPPPMTVERYEKFLPYAVALGVEKPWTKHFESMLPQEASNYHPVWSTGGSHHSASAMNAAMLAGMSTGVASAMPQSSGSSGSGGGGSSGGGGGGGGGGGW